MNKPNPPGRTQDEILARIEQAADDDDCFGFRREVLIDALDFEHARPFLKPDTTAEAWAAAFDGKDIEAQARDYYTFALTKIEGHRGISASRSVDKLTEYAWLLGRDELVAAMGEAEYMQYGAPKIKAFGDALGLDWPDNPELRRMAQGLPCTDDCVEGCGA